MGDVIKKPDENVACQFSWRCDTVRPFVESNTVGEGLDNLIVALELHRLIFFYLSGVTGVSEEFDKNQLPTWSQVRNAALVAGSDVPVVLWEHRNQIEYAIQRVHEIYGAPSEREPEFPANLTEPHWAIDDSACIHLEESSNSILLICGAVARKVEINRTVREWNSGDGTLSSLEQQVLNAVDRAEGSTHDHCSRWYSSKAVSWSYLGKVDAVIRELKRLAVRHETATAASLPAKIKIVSNPQPPANEQQPFNVLDTETKMYVAFDPRGCERWGPVYSDDDWNSIDDCWTYRIEETLYRHRSSDWTMLTVRRHYQAPFLADPEAERIGPDQAAKWLTLNGEQVPPDLVSLSADFRFKPGAPKSSNVAIEDAPVLPRWEKAARKLWLGNKLIRTVASKATDVIKLLDTFQECDWTSEVDSPFTSDEAGKEKRRQALRSANNGLQTIEFVGDGTGEAIQWRIRQHETAMRPIGGDDIPF